MSEIDNTEAIEELVHQAFHDLANEFGIDVDTIADIISRYDEMVAPRLEGKIMVFKN